jgi:hydrogenase maturation protein HypF
MVERAAIHVTGLVQGVGFRPFVYTLATRLGLQGFVQNRGSHVYIDVEGDPQSLATFVGQLVEGPPAAAVERVEHARLTPIHHRGFVIADSSTAPDVSIRIAPDVATCDGCLAELFDPTNRRHRHPFITCTTCGPRYTVITGLPYDRSRTTMAGFAMCAQCHAEYTTPDNRRFHAQSIACHECGPIVCARDRSGPLAQRDHAMARAVAALAAGQIVAIKGIGGYHLACDATNAAAVAELRRRKRREARPLAIMLPVSNCECLTSLTSAERSALSSPERPIVLFDQSRVEALARWRIAGNVAGGMPAVGAFLPYTPVHHLLLHDVERPLVMTSGNRSQEAIAYRDEDAFERLVDIADFFLTHDRPIASRVDDSVVRMRAGGLAPIRRGRGHAPVPIPLAEETPVDILAVGAQLKNACCFVSASTACQTPHIGDLESADTYASLADTVARLSRVLNVQPELVAHDRHPDYLSTRFALQYPGATQVAVQHHHAHALACAAEHRITEPVIGIVFDGAGLGDDGAVWGGEFLLVDGTACTRLAHLSYVPLPGGDAAAREPWRMALAHLTAAFGPTLGPMGERLCARLPVEGIRVVSQMTATGLCSPPTSSMGRLFDAVASITGLRDVATFEGQAAMELEALGRHRAAAHPYHFEVDSTRVPWSVHSASVVRGVANDVVEGCSRAEISASFHAAVACMVADVSARIARATGVRRVVLSGGVFQNALLSDLAADSLAREHLDVFQHRRVPCNDGGLALGQALLAVRLARSGRMAEEQRVCV